MKVIQFQIIENTNAELIVLSDEGQMFERRWNLKGFYEWKEINLPTKA